MKTYDYAIGSIENRVVRALSTDAHRLTKTADGEVGCSCGNYNERGAGIEPAERWRLHLVEAALAAIHGPVDRPHELTDDCWCQPDIEHVGATR